MSNKVVSMVALVLVLCVIGNASGDLVAHWKMDEGSGDIVVDSSGNKHDGAFNGTPDWVAGQLGLALNFDGATYAQVPASQSLDLLNHGDFTVAAWVTTDVVSDSYTVALQQTDASGTGRTWLGVSAGQFYHYLGGSNRWSGVYPELETWYHVAYVVTEGGNSDSMQWYVNGEPTASESASLETNDDGDYLIGCHKALGNLWDGLIDDIRIFDHALTKAQILAVMEGTEGYPFAFSPELADGVLIEDTWANLSWSPGDFAVSHDVYMGDNFDDVDSGAEGTFIGNQAGTFIVVGFPGFPFPDGLVPGTTYYWRIDEVNDTEPNSPWKGDVWSFSIPPKTAYGPDPADSAELVATDAELSWTGGFGAKLHTIYFGDNFDEVNNATGGLPQGITTYNPGSLELAKTYYWRIDEFDAIETHKGNVWSFTTEGAVAALNPANGAVDVTQTPVLTWAPGLGASHEIYFGADSTSLELKGSGNLGSESYEPGQLEWNTTYYWRIDEANNTNADSPWTGPLWSFTTANFLIIDDMEAYNDLDEGQPGSNRIYLAWIDGFDNPAVNGSVVGYANPPFAEQTLVHSGNQSMPFAYDNAVGKSEATLTLTSNRDWTIKGVDTLTIWYRGNKSNAAETMYVVLNGSAGVDNDNPNAALANSWTEWSIDMQAFADQGVNLTNVNTITLGFGNRANPTAGGAGMVFFDDIRLYAPEQ
ncbi:MAG: LamG domain-containing protein [Phycisphaerae bacterium]